MRSQLQAQPVLSCLELGEIREIGRGRKAVEVGSSCGWRLFWGTMWLGPSLEKPPEG